MGFIYLLTTLHLLLLRAYTVAARRAPPLRRGMVRWHGAGLARFYGLWSEGHGRRMRSARGRAESKEAAATDRGGVGGGERNGGGGDNAGREGDADFEGRAAEMKSADGTADAAGSTCPFALVMPPGSDSNLKSS